MRNRRDRIRHWLASRILGDHTNEEICYCQYGIGPFNNPDYYVDGCAVYDMNKRVEALEIDSETATVFREMLDKIPQSKREER